MFYNSENVRLKIFVRRKQMHVLVIVCFVIVYIGRVRATMSEYSETDDTGPPIQLEPGSVVREWMVMKSLGEGGCGVVYEVKNKYGKTAALKVEKRKTDKEDEVLRMEVRVLKKLHNRPHVCQLYNYGKTPEFSFMIVTKLGLDLLQLRRACPQQRLTTSTAIRILFQCLQGVTSLHEAGYIHRDIKPANFALGHSVETKQTIYLLDFGLARQFTIISKKGEKLIREPRADVGFRGTPRYCSMNVHRRLEQGRHDDIWSIIYMAIEFIRGTLPWKYKDKEETKQLKNDVTDRQLLQKCPKEFFVIMAHLKQLNYMTKPNYQLINNQLQSIVTRKCYKWESAFDWEEGGRYYDDMKHKNEQYFKDLESKEEEEGTTAEENINQTTSQKSTDNIATTNQNQHYAHNAQMKSPENE